MAPLPSLLVLLLAGLLYRSFRAFVSRDGSQAVAALCFAGIAASFLLFSGVDLFAQSMTHGPSDIVLISSRDAADFGDCIADSGARGFIAKGELSGATLAEVLRR